MVLFLECVRIIHGGALVKRPEMGPHTKAPGPICLIPNGERLRLRTPLALLLTPTRPLGAARRVHGESTRNHGLSHRVAHCSGGDDQPARPSASDTELVPVRRQGVDAYHSQGSAEIPQSATG